MVSVKKIEKLMNKEFLTTDKWLKIVQNINDPGTLDFVEGCMNESKYARDDWLSARERQVVLAEIDQQRAEVWASDNGIYP